MFTLEDVLEGACSIRPYLPELLGLEAEQVDQQLADLLKKSKAGQQVDQQILELLKSHPKTRNWIAVFLSPKQVSKGYERLPGNIGAVSSQKFVCPEGDYIWYRRTAGIPVPSCPNHGELIPVDRS